MKLKYFVDKGGFEPRSMSKGNAGVDLAATENVTVLPGANGVVVDTKFYCEIPEGYLGLLTHRSGHNFNKSLLVGLGCIDSNYRGEIKVKLYNHGSRLWCIRKGEYFCQMIILPAQSLELEGVDSLNCLSETDRGGKGFGEFSR